MKTASITRTALAVLIVLGLSGSTFAGKTIYVDDNAVGSNDGSSWADAYNYLQDALADANSNSDVNEIRVAQGTYKPDQGVGITPGDREATFQLISGVTIKGGFAGLGKPDPNARDISLYETILSGDMNGDDEPNFVNNSDNSYHVVTAVGTDATAVLDGVAVSGGNANSETDLYPYYDTLGGGMYSVDGSPTLVDCTFTHNSALRDGGAIAGSGDLTIIGCSLRSNKAGGEGGALFLDLGGPTLTDCKLSDNRASSGGAISIMDCYHPEVTFTSCTLTGNTASSCGGGINCSDSEVVVTGCRFSGNVAIEGGAMYCSDTPVTLTNCTFAGNSAESIAAGIYIHPATPITNCIFWDNRTGGVADESAQIHGTHANVNHSCIQGWTGIRGGTGNINDDPLFDSVGHWDDAGTPADQADDIWIDGNYHLQPDSPCIDAGDNTAVPPYLTVDLDGDPRFVDDPETVDTGNGTPPIVDMGAYEGHGQGLVIDPRSPAVAEGGTGTFTVALAMDPLQLVEVTVVRQSGDQDITVQSAATLSFDSSNYDQPQTVTLAVAEDDDNLAGTAVIHLSSTGLPPAFVTAREVDNEPVTPVLYVDAGASGVTGTSWQDAYSDLQVALDVAAQSPQVEQILVAEGVYKPAGPYGSRAATFRLKSGLGVYGGFPAGGGDWGNRDPTVYETILSGDLAGDDVPLADPAELRNEPTRAENCYHVVTLRNTDSTALLDGVVISGGYADSFEFRYLDYHEGGGVYIGKADAKLANCVLRDNYNSSVYTVGGSPTLSGCSFYANRRGMRTWQSSPLLTDCAFFDNSSAMGIAESNPTLTDCTVSHNTDFGVWTSYSNVVFVGCTFAENQNALSLFLGDINLTACTFRGNSRRNGGAIYSEVDGYVTATNCLFVGNSATDDYGAIDAPATLTNCTFVGNTAGRSNGAVGSVTVANSIFWGNSDGLGSGELSQLGSPVDIRHCNVQGWTGIYGGIGNFGADPCFLDPNGGDNTVGTEDDNLRLLPGSPCIDAGDNTAVPPSVLNDLDGRPRIINGTVDMGAYEFQGIQTLYVDADAPQFGDGTSWATAFKYLQDALLNVILPAEIRIAQGIYKPHLNTNTTVPPSRDDTFQLINGVTIKGGYAGLGHSDPNARDISLYETILTGDMNGDDKPNFVNNNDNSYHVVTGSGTNASAVLDGLTIKAGNANAGLYQGRGGGMYIVDGSPTIRYCTFSRNTAYAEEGGFGAGVFIYGGSPALSNCGFIENVVDTGIPAHGGGDGGGICNSGGNPELTDCTFVGNLAAGNNGGGFNNGSGNPILMDCTFKKNSANQEGGGFNNHGGNPTLIGCRFIENSVTAYYSSGGGFHDYAGSSLVVGCIFIDNSANFRGGASCVLRGSPMFANCAFTGNSTGEWGGGVCSTGSDIELVNCTFASNSGLYGNAVTCYSYEQKYPSDLELTNCILWDAGNEIYKNDTSTITVRYSDIQGGWAGAGNIDADPLFVDANGPDNIPGTEDDNLRLLHGSPCVDTGDNTAVLPSVLTDIDGKPRIIGDTVDMGAYEFWGPIYVDDDGPNDPGPGDPQVSDPLENGTEDHPFDTIQEAIDLSVDWYTVLVRQGSYFEPAGGSTVDFLGKNITLESEDPTDWDIIDNTVIRSYVQFSGTEDPNCEFAGFKIRNIEGAIYGNHTHATISHCNISGNGPCGATVIQDCDGTISNCLITDNTTFFFCGVYPVVFECNGLIKNCTIANNESGLSVGSATIENCIIYNNTGPQLTVTNGNTVNISYSNVQDGLKGVVSDGQVNWGPGNIDTDPCFVRLGYWITDEITLIEGDYHLRSEGWRWNTEDRSWTYNYTTSRCVDAGNPGSPLLGELMSVPRDPDNVWGINLRINMGAFGGTSQASLPPYDWALLADLNNDGTVNFFDFAYQTQDWLATAPEQRGDLNRDGVVNKIDLAALAKSWLQITLWCEL